MFISLKVEDEQRWYFDSGSSRHMIAHKCLLTDLQQSNLDFMTFGKDAKGRVLGLGYLNVLRMPKLRDVLLVKGLKASLINISQLCNQDLFVKFTKDRCIVLDQNQCRIMEGSRSIENCYLLASPYTCLYTMQNDHCL